jgi:hypothetical protein
MYACALTLACTVHRTFIGYLSWGQGRAASVDADSQSLAAPHHESQPLLTPCCRALFPLPACRFPLHASHFPFPSPLFPLPSSPHRQAYFHLVASEKSFHDLYCFAIELLDRTFDEEGGTYLTFPEVEKKMKVETLNPLPLPLPQP